MTLIGLLGHAVAGEQVSKVGVAGHEWEKLAQLPGGQKERVASAGGVPPAMRHRFCGSR
jgi:ABC-type polar amino acid transport system ATPase subunit